MPNKYDFGGCNAVVTGSTKGIGLSTARLLGSNGATVVITGRSSRECSEIAQSIPDGIPLACDLSTASARAEFCVQVLDLLDNRLDILVHNAGIYPQGDVESQEVAEFQLVQEINVAAAFDLTKRLLPGLRRGLHPSIVFVSSVVTRLGRGDSPAYTASKSAQIGLSNHLAAELGPVGIRVNCVLPGLVDTPGTRAYGLSDSEFDTFATELQMVPVRIEADDVANVIVFLCSPEARAITAATVDVNGGLRVGG